MNSFWWKFICCSEYWDCLLRKYANNVFCVLSQNVRCDLRNAIQICSLQRLFERFILVIMLDHLIVNFFWSFSLTFSEWRMLILDYWVTYVCSRSVERRMFVLDFSSEVYDETSSLTKHLIKVRRLIKLDESDSSNLTWKDVISSKLTKASSHQTWDRHLIKLFEKRDNLFTFWWAISCSDT
jgi:hypothetical protein